MEEERLVAHLREVCLALPEATEKISHGSPSWFVRKMFASYVGRHHGSEYYAIWVAAPVGVQEEMVDAEPDRFFVPPYVGHRGWLGLRLDVEPGGPDWDEVRAVVTDAYRVIAPKRLVALVD
ncbi:MmcQ/YjbR family DNA-binding protein [Actinomycetospora sp. NBRC 106375]|uniref:MmcQ/YjbR family DNA-binding protein n=1 Tax=Actinomycetospora sp. NBRC 106375 TaxID=3032207 RepID=UPI0025534178|nr:MmcQ/YjbR family DNA-binding protein [Actinomycetospora sp. NBRC 106375]